MHKSSGFEQAEKIHEIYSMISKWVYINELNIAPFYS